MKKVYLRVRCIRAIDKKVPELGMEEHWKMVDAYQTVPHIAIHRSVDEPDCWNLTHIPTGYLLLSGISHRWIAARYCTLLNAAASWNFDDPYYVKNNKEKYELVHMLVGKKRCDDAVSIYSSIVSDRLVLHYGYRNAIEMMKAFITKRQVPCACFACGKTFEMGHFEEGGGYCVNCGTCNIQSIYYLEGLI